MHTDLSAILGRLRLMTVAPLKHANGATETATVNIMAWLEDVELQIPTSQSQSGFVSQMGWVDDVASDDPERRKGTISAPLSAAATVCNLAGTVDESPYKPYIMAAGMCLTGLSEFARALGYSRPSILDTITTVRDMRAPFLANSDRDEVIQKYTLDSKAELTVDPRVVGIEPKDELTIQSIACRESFLCTFPWATTSATDTFLWGTGVNPMLTDAVVPGTSTSAILMTPVAFAALPFEYWRGTLNFRFTVVASSHHKGRLRIVYDPVNYTAGAPFNVNYTRIVDISTVKDFVLPVSWCNNQAFRAVEASTPYNRIWNTSATPGVGSGNNGTLSVFVLNELTSPSSLTNNDVQVMVSVSAGDDFEVALPNPSVMQKMSVFTSQSGDVSPEETQVTSSSLGSLEIETIGAVKGPENLYKVFFGERIMTFRTLMKRYATYTTFVFPGASRLTSQPYIWRPTMRVWPVWYGYDPDGVGTNVATKKYNPVNNHIISYLAPCFMMRRGGMRYKFIYDNPALIAVPKLFGNRYVATGQPAWTNAAVLVPSATTNDPANAYTLAALGNNDFGGTAYAHDGVLEVECPFYKPYRFLYSKMNNTVSGIEEEYLQLQARAHFASGSIGTITAYMAAAEDTNFHMFLYVPRMWMYTVTTA